MAKRAAHPNGTTASVCGGRDDGRTVFVTRTGGVIRITPPVTAMNLITTRRAAEAGPGDPVRLRWQSSPVFRPAEDPDGNPVLVGPGHLEDLAAQMVRAGGGPSSPGRRSRSGRSRTRPITTAPMPRPWHGSAAGPGSSSGTRPA